MFPWSDTPGAAPTYAVGATVYSGEWRGTVVSVDREHGTIDVVWSDASVEWDFEGSGAITYPADAGYLRKALPWE